MFEIYATVVYNFDPNRKGTLLTVIDNFDDAKKWADAYYHENCMPGDDCVEVYDSNGKNVYGAE